MVVITMRLYKYGGWGYDHFLTNLALSMKKEGITEEQLHVLLVESPASFLDIAQ
jgi:phosphotriesterase-related protein